MKNQMIKALMVMMLVLMTAVAVASPVTYASDAVRYTDQADILNELGLFSGTNVGYELDRAPKRVEVAAMLVKFLGAETEANAMKYAHPFTDVPEWADAIVGYMYEKGLTKGVGNNLFGSSNPATAKDYTVFLLKALGYDMTDFEYASTMSFAVQVGLMEASDSSNISSRTFRRDEMVYLSYKSLFATLKGSTNTLGTKLGMTSIPTARTSFTLTVERVADPENPKYVKFVFDTSKFPADYSDFTYLGESTVYWTFPTTNEIIHYMNPELTFKAVNPSPYNPKANDYYGLGKNMIVTLFDSNKKAIGFFEIMNNDKLGKVDVTVKPVKALNLSIPKITTGVTVTTKGELVIDRNGLPSSVKNYAKVAFADNPTTNPAGIYFSGMLNTTDQTTKFYTNGTIDLTSVTEPLGNLINLYFYDSNNKLIGYATPDSANATDAIKAKLSALNIKEIKNGMVYIGSKSVKAYMIPSETDYPDVSKIKYWGLGSVTTEYNVSSLVLSQSKKTSPYNVAFGLGGVQTMISTDSNAVMFVAFYDANKKMIAYSLSPRSAINQRKDAIKTLTVYFDGSVPVYGNNDFSVEFYKAGKLVDTVGFDTMNMIMENGKVIGEKFPNLFVDPTANYEIKIKSNNPALKMTKFLLN